jgi:hypothetical protein
MPGAGSTSGTIARLHPDWVSTAERELGSRALFGEFGGIGWRFGRYHQFGVSARIIHESNAGIRQPNDGLTTYVVRLEHAFP